MNTKVINLIGGAGIGKSINAALFFAELKLMGKTCEYVQEFAKEIVWSNHLSLLSDQRYLLEEQSKRIAVLDGKVEYIVTDGSLINQIYYNSVSNVHSDVKLQIESEILFNYFLMDNINFVINRNLNVPFEESGRVHSLDEAIVTDNRLKEILKFNEIPYIKMDFGKEGVAGMVNMLESIEKNHSNIDF